MMFLFQVLLVITAAFWASATVAEAVFTSNEEISLHPFIRVTLGYILMLVWFGVAWKYMTIKWAWVLGITLLALYGHKGVMADGGIAPWGAALFKKYSRPFAWILAGEPLFILPLHMSGNYGPFTEMGGDVVVYSETPKYLVDNNLPCYGVSDIIFYWD